MVYSHDEAGNALEGDKNDLIDAVRKGYPVRMGFGGRRSQDTTKSVEHIVDAHFLTIANSEEVFGQIEPIIGQHPGLTMDTLNVTFREDREWTIIIGTNGFSDRLTTDRLNNEILGHNERFVNVRWFVFSPTIIDLSKQEAAPLW